MNNYITKNFFNLIILGLLALLIFKSFKDKPNDVVDSITHKSDTLYVVSQGANITTKPTIINHYYDSTDTIIIPTDSTLLKKYISDLRKELFTINIYKDSLKIDSLGYVTVVDSIKNNLIKNRSYSYNLKYPVITNTITITEAYKPKSQLFIGGEVFGNKQSPLNSINGGILLKTKADNIYALKAGVQTFNGIIQPAFGFGLYWKLQLKK